MYLSYAAGLIAASLLASWFTGRTYRKAHKRLTQENQQLKNELISMGLSAMRHRRNPRQPE